jgi:tripeptidyl-peptidase-1
MGLLRMLCVFLCIVYGAPPAAAFEAVAKAPSGWTELRRASSSSRIQLRIFLRQPNYSLFENSLLAVSTPGHPHYGKHLTRLETKEILKPDHESTKTVLDWLSDSGILDGEIRNEGEWIQAFVSVTKAEMILNTTFHVYRNEANNMEAVRSLGYQVPPTVADHITMVQPTTRFGYLTPQNFGIHGTKVLGMAKEVLASESSPTQLNLTACNESITPSCLRVSDSPCRPSIQQYYSLDYVFVLLKYDHWRKLLKVIETTGTLQDWGL